QRAYEEAYQDLHTLEPEERERILRAEGRKSGQAALVQAFKDKILVPSTVAAINGEIEGYEEYYTRQWQMAQVQQKTAVVNPGPGDENQTAEEGLDALEPVLDTVHTTLEYHDDGIVSTTIENHGNGLIS